jgi:hypothetical protein
LCLPHFTLGSHPPQDYAADSFTFKDYKFTRVPVEGLMATQNILEACAKIGQKPVCDYPAYSDGRCTMVEGYNFHFSQPSHNEKFGIDLKKTLGAYFYSGNANGQWSLKNRGNDHTWSGTNDFDGDTFCVTPTKAGE